MIVKEYIKQRFQSFGIELSEADFSDMCVNSNLNANEEVCEHNHVKVNVAIARFIPSLLARPASVNESGFSVSWNAEGMKAYYSFLCKTYGLEDVLNTKPKVTFL